MTNPESVYVSDSKVPKELASRAIANFHRITDTPDDERMYDAAYPVSRQETGRASSMKEFTDLYGPLIQAVKRESQRARLPERPLTDIIDRL